MPAQKNLTIAEVFSFPVASTNPVNDPGGRFWYIPAQVLIMDVMIGEHLKWKPKYQTWTFLFFKLKGQQPSVNSFRQLGFYLEEIIKVSKKKQTQTIPLLRNEGIQLSYML